MAIKDYNSTASNNTSISGIGIQGTNAVSNFDGAFRQIMADVANWTDTDTIASAATTDLSTVEGTYVTVSGTTTITAFGTLKSGMFKFLKFDGALTLTHNATSLILPGAANITTAAGDTAFFVSHGSGNWRCLVYQPAAAAAIASQAEAEAGTATNRMMTPQRTKQAIDALSDLVVIGTGTVAAAAALDLTDLSTSYRAYLLAFDDLLPVTDGDTLLLRTSTDNGVSFSSGASDYGHARVSGGSAGAAVGAGSTGATAITLLPAVDNTNGLEVSGQIWIYNPASNDSRTTVTAEFTHLSSANEYLRTSSGGRRNSTESNNAIRIFFSGGNITTMRYTFYGVRFS